MYKGLKEKFWEIEKSKATKELTLLQKSRSWYYKWMFKKFLINIPLKLCH
jgi:hypothetical protein